MPNDKSATIKVPAKVRPDNSTTGSLLPYGVLLVIRFQQYIVHTGIPVKNGRNNGIEA